MTPERRVQLGVEVWLIGSPRSLRSKCLLDGEAYVYARSARHLDHVTLLRFSNGIRSLIAQSLSFRFGVSSEPPEDVATRRAAPFVDCGPLSPKSTRLTFAADVS